MSQWQELEHKYFMKTVERLPVTIVRGQGARVWDENGREYLHLSVVYLIRQKKVKTASADSIDYHYAGYAHTIEQNIHVFRTVEGNYAKVRIDLFGYFGGEDYNIEWVYQTDGSTNLDHLVGVEESTWGAIKQVFESD